MSKIAKILLVIGLTFTSPLPTEASIGNRVRFSRVAPRVSRTIPRVSRTPRTTSRSTNRASSGTVPKSTPKSIPKTNYTRNSDTRARDFATGAVIGSVASGGKFKSLFSLILQYFFYIAVAIIMLVVLNYVLSLLNRDTKEADTQEETYREQEKYYQHEYLDNSKEDEIVEKIKEKDAHFDIQLFKELAKNSFVNIQEAWSNKDLEKLKRYETSTLFDTHSKQIQEYIDNQTTDKVEKIYIDKVVLTDYKENDKTQEITVKMNVVFRNYIIDDNTNEIIDGYEDVDIELTQTLVFTREIWKKSSQQKISANNCNSCGAKNSIDEKGVCQYCGNINQVEWVVNQFE